jgi:hypothetical protein
VVSEGRPISLQVVINRQRLSGGGGAVNDHATVNTRLWPGFSLGWLFGADKLQVNPESGHGLNWNIPENQLKTPRRPTETIKVAGQRSVPHHGRGHVTSSGERRDGRPFLASRPHAYQRVRFGTWLSRACLTAATRKRGEDADRADLAPVSSPWQG